MKHFWRIALAPAIGLLFTSTSQAEEATRLSRNLLLSQGGEQKDVLEWSNGS